ncbi:MAG TPA: VWA domain-containing protein [bacterium]|nr:VWA domain-containing protein [bacterium]
MEFGNHLAIYLIWIAAAGALLFVWELRWTSRALARFVSAGVLPKVARGYSRRRKILKRALVVAALATLILAWGMPRVGKGMRVVKREGADVVIALDLSASMLTPDVKPSRIELARRAIETLSARLGGDRLALVGFADDAFIYCPLTLDESALAMFVDYLSPDVVADQGTNVGRAIDESLKALQTSSGKGKAIVIVTDGEDHGQQVDEAVKLARDQGVRIYSLGVGTEAGEPIPLLDARGNVAGYKRDREDNVVVSKLDVGLLRELARATGGESFLLGPAEREVTKIADDIHNIEKGVVEQRSFEQYMELFQIPLAISLLLLLGEGLIGEKRRNA